MDVKEIPLTGKLVTSEDPATIGTNFQTLQNLRPTKTHLKGIGGMSKINTAIYPGKVEVLDNWSKQTGDFAGAGASLTPSAGANRLAIILVSTEDSGTARTISSMTLGGQSCVKINEQTEATEDTTLSLWYLKESLIAAMSGAAILITWSSAPSDDIIVSTAVYQSVHQTTLVAANSGTSGSDITPTPTEVAVTDKDHMFYVTSNDVGHAVHLSSAGYVEQFNTNATDNSSAHAIATKAITVTGTKKPTATWSSGTGICMINAVLRWDGTSVSSFIKSRSGFHYKKDAPAESHVLVQTFNDGETISEIIENTTAIPSTGAFGSVIHSDKNGAGNARFSNTSNGQVVACNGEESLIWGGNEMICAAFITCTSDPYSSDSSDYTRAIKINNELAENLAVFNRTHMYVGSLRPLKGIKVSIKIANTATTTLIGAYWNGAWTVVSSISDGTSVSSVTLAQTGSITFEEQSDAKPTFLFDRYLYWYRFYDGVTGTIDTNMSISYVTQDAAMQGIVDLWDGSLRTCIKAIWFDDSPTPKTYTDYTANIIEEDYQSANDYTFVDLSGFATADKLYLGFSERQASLLVTMGDSGNTAASVLVVKYWHGSGFTTTSGLNDGTSPSGSDSAFSQSGVISWTPPNERSEFRTDINNNGVNLYYYEITVTTAVITGTVPVDYIAGITAQKLIGSYQFPLTANNRLWLCSETDGKKNKAICSAFNASSVWNGDDTTEYEFGDDSKLTAGGHLYAPIGSSLYNMTIFMKAHEIWLLVGNSPEDWTFYRASANIGCVAPLTMKPAHIVTEEGSKQVYFFQGSDGIYLFDGRSPMAIHGDIEDIFDKRSSTVISSSWISKSVGEFDEYNQEYHFFYSDDGSSLNKEVVYSLKRQGWYYVSRGTGLELQCAFNVEDTDGNKYMYGCIDTGYMEHLENGNDFDGGDIVHVFRFGDIAPASLPGENKGGSIFTETIIRGIKSITTAKTTTTNAAAVTYYLDGITSGTTLETAHDPTNTGYRIKDTYEGLDLGSGIFHSFKFSMTTDNETIGYEPLFIALKYEPQRIDST